MKFLALTLFFLSYPLFAEQRSCMDDYDCYDLMAKKCYLVTTGQDQEGRATCELNCAEELMDGYCDESQCVADVAMPDFDPENPDCSAAVNPDEL